MAEKSADIQTLAPRVDWLEQMTGWLKDNRGGSGGGTTDETLWKATLTGAVTGATWGNEPWLATDLIYGPDSPNDTSMHLTVFGNNSEGALKCQDGKGFYGWVFPTTETRWQYGPENGSRSLANEVFDQPDSGYVHALRAATLSLMQAVFKDVSYVGSYTIIDRILDLAEELEELATNAQEAIGEIQTDMQAGFDSINTAIDDINGQLVSIRNRLTAGGL